MMLGDGTFGAASVVIYNLQGQDGRQKEIAPAGVDMIVVSIVLNRDVKQPSNLFEKRHATWTFSRQTISIKAWNKW